VKAFESFYIMELLNDGYPGEALFIFDAGEANFDMIEAEFDSLEAIFNSVEAIFHHGDVADVFHDGIEFAVHVLEQYFCAVAVIQ
jgi:hypothetical protein